MRIEEGFRRTMGRRRVTFRSKEGEVKCVITAVLVTFGPNHQEQAETPWIFNVAIDVAAVEQGTSSETGL